MTAHSFLIYALIFLTASVISVPLSKKLGFGSVLGYLIAGALIGPNALSLVYGSEDLAHFAELGVVFLLFLIGLELQPKRLWDMRSHLLNLGLGQIIGSTCAIGLIFHFGLKISWMPSLVAGFALALSSTAFSLQSLIEKGELKTPYGQSVFSVLLMQDIVAIPALAVIPFLGVTSSNQSYDFAHLFGVLIFIAFLIVSSRTWVGRLFRWIASSGSREIFTATTLLLVLAVSYAMYSVGVSMGLGAFLAGVLLADSEYRHEIEVDLEPFKALLMGIFFMSVGITVPLEQIISDPLRILGWVILLMGVKFVVMYGVGRASGQSPIHSRSSAMYLALGGEFAFVISGLTVKIGLLPNELAQTINLVVTFSMVLTPVLFYVVGLIDQRQQKDAKAKTQFDKIDHQESQVIIAGFGRFGQIFGRILRAQGISFTAIDHDPDQIQLLRRFGNKVYYGDCSREEILHAAGADRAKFLVLAIDDVRASVETAQTVRERFPHIKIFARARNRQHAYELLEMGIQKIKRETVDSSINFTGELLQEMGFSAHQAHRIVGRFRDHDETLMREQFKNRHDEKTLISVSKKAVEQLEQVLRDDAKQSYINLEKASPPNPP